MDKTLERTVKKVARELDTLAEGWGTDDYADIFEWLCDQLEVVPHWVGFAKEYQGVEVTVTYGGPTITVSTLASGGVVEGSYGSENHTYHLEDATVAAIDDAVQSMAD